MSCELLHQLTTGELPFARDLEHVQGARLRRADGGWLTLDQDAARALATYLRQQLARPASGQALMLGCVGGGRLGVQAVQVRLRALGRRAKLKANLTPRRLRQSALKLEDVFARPRLPLIWPDREREHFFEN
ncbi:MAG: hypothetical protein AMXMBFR33_23990 [Candidatus Xenobia bacterium]